MYPGDRIPDPGGTPQYRSRRDLPPPRGALPPPLLPPRNRFCPPPHRHGRREGRPADRAGEADRRRIVFLDAERAPVRVPRCWGTPAAGRTGGTGPETHTEDD